MPRVLLIEYENNCTDFDGNGSGRESEGAYNALGVHGCCERLGPAKPESQKQDVPLTLRALGLLTVAVKNLHLMFIIPMTTYGHLVCRWRASGKAQLSVFPLICKMDIHITTYT